MTRRVCGRCGCILAVSQRPDGYCVPCIEYLVPFEPVTAWIVQNAFALNQLRGAA